MQQYQNIKYSALNSVELNCDRETSKSMSNQVSNEKEKDVFETATDSYLSTSEITEMRYKNDIRKSLNENITTVVHILTIQFVIFILYLSFSYEVELFTWHPILLSVGWSLFMTQAILAISTENWFTKFISAKNRVLVHWVLQVCASACIISGFTIVVINKNLKNKNHFTTWHGIFGLVSYILFLITCAIGVVTLYKVDLRQYISPKLNKVCHIFLGGATFIFGVITVILSLYSNWFVKKTNYSAQVICFIAVMLISVWVLVRPVKIVLRSILHW